MFLQIKDVKHIELFFCSEAWVMPPGVGLGGGGGQGKFQDMNKFQDFGNFELLPVIITKKIKNCGNSFV